MAATIKTIRSKATGDIIYPITKGSAVYLNDNITTVDDAIAVKVNKAGDTLMGPLTVVNDTNNGNTFSTKANFLDINTIPSQHTYVPMLRCYDENDASIATIYAMQSGMNGSNGIRLQVGRTFADNTSTWNRFSLWCAMDGSPSVDVSAPQAWRKALGMTQIETTTVADIITASSSVTISDAMYVQYGRVATLQVVYTNNNAFNIGPTGAMDDITIGTIVNGKRPQYIIYPVCSNTVSSVPLSCYNVYAGGNIVFMNSQGNGSTRTINAGSTFRFYATYMVAA